VRAQAVSESELLLVELALWVPTSGASARASQPAKRPRATEDTRLCSSRSIGRDGAVLVMASWSLTEEGDDAADAAP